MALTMSSIRKKSSITFDVNSDSHERQLAHPFVHRAMASSNAQKSEMDRWLRGAERHRELSFKT
jgi:hypothetical protein